MNLSLRNEHRNESELVSALVLLESKIIKKKFYTKAMF